MICFVPVVHIGVRWERVLGSDEFPPRGAPLSWGLVGGIGLLVAVHAQVLVEPLAVRTSQVGAVLEAGVGQLPGPQALINSDVIVVVHVIHGWTVTGDWPLLS